jgi:hypothetical protein
LAVDLDPSGTSYRQLLFDKNTTTGLIHLGSDDRSFCAATHDGFAGRSSEGSHGRREANRLEE